MRSSLLRWLSRLGSLLVLGLGLAAPAALHAAPKVVAHHGPPSSVSALYGRPITWGDPSIVATYLVPTGTGFEVRDAAVPNSDPVGVWRAPGPIHEIAHAGGPAIYAFAGAQGIAMVDFTTPSIPILTGSRVDPTPAVLGAALQASNGLAVSDGASIQLYRRTSPSALVPLTPITYADGRQIVAIRARADSFLVASARSAPGARIILTLYQLPSGASAAVQLREVQVPLQTPSDLAWKNDLAFVAAGSGGVVVANMRTGLFHTTALPSNRAVRALDVNDSLVVAAVVASGLAKFRRTGALGDTLGGYTVEPLDQEPTHVTLVGTRAIVTTQEVIAANEPDEVGRSVIEVRDIDVPIAVAPAGGTGRVRRVVTAGGYAYVADYLGGLRVYRSGVSDTSLVGVLPTTLASGVLDLAVDAAHGRAYLASSTSGLQVVDISDPASPTLLATLPLTERAFTVAVVDSNTVIVGGKGFSLGGVTLVDVSTPSAPAPLGHLLLEDPRAIAVKDTVAFVADALQGLVSVAVGTPTNPTMIGEPSGTGAEDVDLTGNLLLVATRTAGLQIVDATVPTLLNLRSTLPLPRMYGVAGSGLSAVALLGDEPAAVIDLSNSFQPVIRGPVAFPGFARDASWVGDTVLVAADYSLERLLIVPAEQSVPALVIAFDAARPIAHISWDPVVRSGLVGLRLYRDILAPLANPGGESVNADLLPPSSTTAVDTLAVGTNIRYRLEAVLMDGSSIEVARGTATIPSSASVGHPYPNPFRPGGSLIVTVPMANGVANLRVTIHDARGRLVRQIELPGLSSSGSGGFRQVTWDGRDGAGRIVPSGVYFMAFEGQGLSDAKRIVVLR